MSTTIKSVRPGHPVYDALGLRLYPSVRIATAPENKGIRLGRPAAIQHSGKLEERDAPITKLMQGRIYSLDFGTMQSNIYDVIISVNPKIGLSGVLTNPGLLPAKSKHHLSFPIYTIRQIDLQELDWIVSISVLT